MVIERQIGREVEGSDEAEEQSPLKVDLVKERPGKFSNIDIIEQSC